MRVVNFYKMPIDHAVAIIPARRGSKGLPGKNTLSLCGKPMIQWTIESALECSFFNRVVVTTNDPEVMEIVDRTNPRIHLIERPQKLCDDNVPGVSVALHVIETFPEFSRGIFLQPTSPLRQTRDIQNIYQYAVENEYHSVVSVTEEHKPINWIMRFDAETGDLQQFSGDEILTLRQGAEKLFRLNGAIYYFQSNWLRTNKQLIGPGTKGFVMPYERSMDVDSLYDFWLTEKILSNQKALK